MWYIFASRLQLKSSRRLYFGLFSFTDKNAHYDRIVDSKNVTVLRITGCSGVVECKSCISDEHINGQLHVCVLADGTKDEVPVASVSKKTL